VLEINPVTTKCCAEKRKISSRAGLSHCAIPRFVNGGEHRVVPVISGTNAGGCPAFSFRKSYLTVLAAALGETLHEFAVVASWPRPVQR
jgi:hypothetical protein